MQQVLSVGKHTTSAKRRKTCNWTLAETYFSGKLKPPAEKAVLKITRYAQRLTQDQERLEIMQPVPSAGII